MKNFKINSWRIIVAISAVAFVAFMATNKRLGSLYAKAPEDYMANLMFRAILDSFIKVALIAIALIVIRWIILIIIKKRK